MSRRDNSEARCPACHLHQAHCICALIPALVPRTRLALLVHYTEARKPTNTGQLAARCLAGSEVHIVGDRARPLALPIVRPGERGLVLSPDADAGPIEDHAGAGDAGDGPLVLVVPDGTWRQAGKMRRRVPGLAELPCVTLPATRPTTYRLRAEPKAGGLATLEAIAQALGVLEGAAGPALEAALLAVFDAFVERTLRMRGAQYSKPEPPMNSRRIDVGGT